MTNASFSTSFGLYQLLREIFSSVLCAFTERKTITAAGNEVNKSWGWVPILALFRVAD